MYHAGLGTFLQRDPLPPDGEPSVGYSHEYVTARMREQNLYAYTSGNPINATDPLGLQSVSMSEEDIWRMMDPITPVIVWFQHQHASGCHSLEAWIESQLSTVQEKASWRRFVSGRGGVLELDPDDLVDAFGGNRNFLEAIEAARCACEEGNKPAPFRGGIAAGAPHSLSLGPTTVTISFECEGKCVRWTASINDRYDFNTLGVPGFTRRSFDAEAKTLGVAIAQYAARCGWREFKQQGSWSGRTCDPLPARPRRPSPPPCPQCEPTSPYGHLQSTRRDTPFGPRH